MHSAQSLVTWARKRNWESTKRLFAAVNHWWRIIIHMYILGFQLRPILWSNGHLRLTPHPCTSHPLQHCYYSLVCAVVDWSLTFCPLCVSVPPSILDLVLVRVTVQLRPLRAPSSSRTTPCSLSSPTPSWTQLCPLWETSPGLPRPASGKKQHVQHKNTIVSALCELPTIIPRFLNTWIKLWRVQDVNVSLEPPFSLHLQMVLYCYLAPHLLLGVTPASLLCMKGTDWRRWLWTMKPDLTRTTLWCLSAQSQGSSSRFWQRPPPCPWMTACFWRR